jgi:Tol biopolymer transport system component
MDLFGRDQRQVTSYAGPGEVYYVAWSPDDGQLLVTVAEDFGARVLTMPAAGGPLQEFLPAWSSFPTVGPDWTMAYVTWANDDTDVLLANGSGASLGDVSASAVNEDAPNINADGSRVVYQVGDRGGRYVEFLDLTTGEYRALPQLGDDSNPVWSPDGTAIACVIAVNGVEEVYVRPLDGGEAIRLDIAAHDQVWYLAWSA